MDVLGKRSFDPSFGADAYHDPKRAKTQEILGEGSSQQACTRVLMDRNVFAKIIGKGGQMISQIRTTCGANVKGLDIDSENRLVVISGSLRQTLEAFEKVTDLLNTAYIQQQSNPPTEPFMVHILVEHNKAGKVIGPTGTTLQDMKLRSGVHQVRVQKDPRDFSGVLMRVVTIEGSALAVKKAHFCFQELFLPEPAHLLAMSESGAGDMGGGGGGAPSHTSFGKEAENEDIMSYQGGRGGSGEMEGSSMSQRGGGGNGGSVVSIPLNALPSFGVPQEVVSTLSELKSLFASQFGLDLAVTRLGGSGGGSSNNSRLEHQMGGGQGTVVAGSAAGTGRPVVPYNELLTIPGRAVEYEDMVVFSVPKNSAGVIIGKGGQVLKDIQTEFGVRVFVEKEGEVAGMRLVVLKSASTTDQALTEIEKAAMKKCQEHIMSIVAAEQEKDGGGDGADGPGSGSSGTAAADASEGAGEGHVGTSVLQGNE